VPVIPCMSTSNVTVLGLSSLSPKVMLAGHAKCPIFARVPSHINMTVTFASPACKSWWNLYSKLSSYCVVYRKYVGNGRGPFLIPAPTNFTEQVRVAVTLCTCIQKGPYSNPNRDLAYLECFVWVSVVVPGKFRARLLVRRPLFSNPSSIIIFIIIIIIYYA
jgi:hypothetical protein